VQRTTRVTLGESPVTTRVISGIDTACLSEGTFDEFLRRQVDAYVFHVEGKDTNTTFGRMFARLLSKAGLLKDPRSGTERTLYSLRHTYATLMLTLNRLSIYTLAEHMGTSVKMIEDHYGHVQLRKKAREIAGNGGRR
jgi:integrase